MPARSRSGRREGQAAPVADGYSVRAVVRAVDLLDLLRGAGRAGMSIQELSDGSGLAKASAYRMLKTLEGIGLVERLPASERYRLGVRCLELGQAYLEQTDLRQEARPVMERLRAEFKETVHLAVLDDRLRVVYLEKLDGAHAVGIMMSRVGSTAPSHCTGLGKALLSGRSDDPVALLQKWGELRRYTPTTISAPGKLRAELERIRANGYAIDHEEHEPGVRCTAALIPGLPGGVLAALSIAGPALRMSDELLRGRLAEAVVAAAAEVAARTGGSPKARA